MQPDSFHVCFSVLCNTAIHNAHMAVEKKRKWLVKCQNGFKFIVFILDRCVTEKNTQGEAVVIYLSRMNSAISFCICFPFSCFCSKTSNPVMQLLLWASLLSFCNVSNKSLFQKWQTYWYWSDQSEIRTTSVHKPHGYQERVMQLSFFWMLKSSIWDSRNTKNIMCNKVFIMSIYSTYSISTTINHARSWAYCAILTSF